MEPFPGIVATPSSNLPPTADGQCPSTTTPSGVSPLPASCLNQRVIVPRTPTDPATGTAILTRTFSVEIPGEREAVINYVMRDPSGAPVDLRACLCPNGASESSSLSQSQGDNDDACCPYKLVFRLNEYLSGGTGCEFPVTAIDPANGTVAVTLTSKDTQRPGVYFGEFAMVECYDAGQEPVVIFSNRLYVIIGRNLWNNRMSCVAAMGPPSISEIRLHLRDTDPSESYLLDNLAFSDEEIAQALWLPVQYWNEIPPPIGTYTTANFPFRYHWLMATAGYLFLTAAEQQRRNHLNYAAGGVQVNDQDKEPNYEQAAKRRLDEYKDFVRRKKAEINLNSAYGELGSRYGMARFNISPNRYNSW